MEYTIDDFLGGLVHLKQAKQGYRATSDAVLLASSIPASSGESILDVGCGNGVVALCLGARVHNLTLTGIEIQPELVALAKENADVNHQNFSVIKGDISKNISELKSKTFHHVMTNPPYFTESNTRQDIQQATAYQETLPLDIWIDFCLKYLRPQGTFTIIHRTQRIPEILALLRKRLGGISLVPFWPKEGLQPKRILIQGTLGSKKPFVLHPGFVLHQKNNSRTPEIESVMRCGNALKI